MDAVPPRREDASMATASSLPPAFFGLGAPGAIPGALALESAYLAAHAALAHVKPAFGIVETARDGGTVPVREAVVAKQPFCRLLRFAREGADDDPKVVLVAPMSGHHASLLRDTIAALVPDHDVFVTDWIDAAAVPRRHGEFDLADMIGYVVGFLRRLGPSHLVGVCQSGTPALAAVALMAAMEDPARPRSLTLMGGLIDTRIDPTPMNLMAREAPLAVFERALVSTVPPWAPGAGRRVHGAYAQLAGLAAYLTKRISRGDGSYLATFEATLVNDGAAPGTHLALYDEFLTLMDLPANLYLETIAAVLQTHALPRGLMIWRGRRVDPALIRDVALMTVEGGGDDISGAGQTRVAHDLCPGIPGEMRRHHDEPEIGHLGLFHGRRWRENILPRLRGFIRAHDRGETARTRAAKVRSASRR
jgi:poly(3-hydroxybutyrate) depolymerase